MALLDEQPYVGYPQMGRRRAMPNTDVQMNQGLLRGASYYPYDLLGSPVDLINMALTPIGLGSEKPVMGSAYLQSLAQRAGLSAQPTGSNSENIARLVASLTNPAAGARAAGRVVEPTVQALAPKAGQMAEDYLRSIGGIADIVPTDPARKQALLEQFNKISGGEKPVRSAVVLIGDKIFTGNTHTQAFEKAIQEGVVRKEGKKFIYPEGAEVNSDLFMLNDGSIVDRLTASRKLDVGSSEGAMRDNLMQIRPAKSMGIDEYMRQAEEIKNQRNKPKTAMQIAQENAALPISEGGLGLLSSNTAMDRAKALGYDTPVYHGTNQDIEAFNVEGKGKTAGAGAFLTTNPITAETYVSASGGGNILPLLLRKDNFLTANARGRNWADIYTNELNARAGKNRYTPQELGLDINSATSTDELGMIANDLSLKGAEIKNVRDLGPNSHVMRSKEYLFNKYGIVPDETFSNVTGEQWAESQRAMQKLYDSQKSDIYAVQDPSLIRSRFAAFDPKRINEPNLLAGVIPFGLLADDEEY